jgi:putative sugar O-methyltransferase
MYNTYTNFIKSFIHSDIKYWDFKKKDEYCAILEHATKEHGDNYLFEIKNRFDVFYNENKDFLIDICNTNDSCGKPIKYNFENFTSCSPTNIRYILHSLLILSYMKECELRNIDIIEIGGGYGGLCLFLYKLSPLFNIDIHSYSIFDLPEPLELQKKYLENVNIDNVNFMELDNIKNLNKNSFLISNYAFSEISMDIQKKYTNHVLNPYTSHGFLTWNFINTYQFIDNKYITIENEYPSTSVNNKYVRFKPLN